MRRKDREQSEEFGWSVLETCPYAVLSTTDDEGLPYGIPVSPAVLDGVIYFHSAKHGTKSKLLRKHPDVCLVGVRDVVPLPEAYSTEYASAVVRGTVAEVTDDGHVDHAQQRDRDVGDDVRNGQREDFTVHAAKVRLFCILSAAFRPFRS